MRSPVTPIYFRQECKIGTFVNKYKTKKKKKKVNTKRMKRGKKMFTERINCKPINLQLSIIDNNKYCNKYMHACADFTRHMYHHSNWSTLSMDEF